MMRSELDHENLRVYQAAIGWVAWLEEEVSGITSSVSASDHLARAAAGIPVNIAQASGKRSMNERRQCIDTAYGSSLECAACLDILCLLACLRTVTVHNGKNRLSTLVSMLIGFRKSTVREVREEGAAYLTASSQGGLVWFDHEKLDVYRKALDFVVWCGELRSNTGRLPRSAVTSLDKASTSVALNIAESNGRFSMKDRCRFIGHARTAALQAAATLDVLAARKILAMPYVPQGKRCLADIVRMLVAWERSLEER